jgi:hypothetical protein
MRFPLMPATALAGALVLGCDDSSDLTDLAPAATPSLQANVSRFDAPFFNIVIDPKRGLTALFGFTFENLLAACAGGPAEDLAHYLIVFHTTRAGRDTVLHFRVRDKDQSAIVWAAIPEESPCEFQEVQPLAVGTVHFANTDNDFFNLGPGRESVSFLAAGTVTGLGTGQRYHLVAKTQLQFLSDGTPPRFVSNFVRLKRIGG